MGDVFQFFFNNCNLQFPVLATVLFKLADASTQSAINCLTSADENAIINELIMSFNLLC